MSPPNSAYGVRIAGVGSAVPEKVLTNADLEKMVDTSDEWILKRTGISERRIVDPQTEGTYTLSCDALRRALQNAGIRGDELDLIIVATVTAEMTCPSTACRVSMALGAAPAAAFDLVAACSGFVYSINIADPLVRSGIYRTIGVVGCDAMTTVVDFSERTVSVLFGDAAGAVVLQRDDDQSMALLEEVRTQLRDVERDDQWSPLREHRDAIDPLSNESLRNILLGAGKAALHALLSQNADREPS